MKDWLGRHRQGTAGHLAAHPREHRLAFSRLAWAISSNTLTLRSTRRNHAFHFSVGQSCGVANDDFTPELALVRELWEEVSACDDYFRAFSTNRSEIGHNRYHSWAGVHASQPESCTVRP